MRQSQGVEAPFGWQACRHITSATQSGGRDQRACTTGTSRSTAAASLLCLPVQQRRWRQQQTAAAARLVDQVAHADHHVLSRPVPALCKQVLQQAQWWASQLGRGRNDTGTAGAAGAAGRCEWWCSLQGRAALQTSIAVAWRTGSIAGTAAGWRRHQSQGAGARLLACSSS